LTPDIHRWTGREVQALRDALRLTKRSFAAKLGVSHRTVTNWEENRVKIAPFSASLLDRLTEGADLTAVRRFAELVDRPRNDVATAACDVGSSDDPEEIRRLLARVAEVTLGTAVLDPDSWMRPMPDSIAPLPSQIGRNDVARLASVTAGLYDLDYRHGGGCCREAVVAQVRWAQSLLRSDFGEDVGHLLHVALADLHILAGWTSFDVGLGAAARQHFGRALEQAKHANEPALMAKVLYCLGRLHLHRNWLSDALKFFQLGQIAAVESGSEIAVAMVCANEAWTYALLGNSSQATKSATRAEDEFVRGRADTAPRWVSFFGEADLDASIATALACVPDPTDRQRAAAIEGFERSLAARGPGTSRSRAFELASLATVHLQDGNLDQGTRLGNEAIDLAEQIRSARVVDRLGPLHLQARRRPTNADAQDLAARIATLQDV
jgi:transcriptional regulator with XRE-family HTH domain/tetratricopeptide (TPR) repeat protein